MQPPSIEPPKVPASAPDYFTFDMAALSSLAQRSHSRYQSNAPFPHIVLDDFLPDAVARRLHAQFPDVNAPIFVNRSSQYQPGKYGTFKGKNIAAAPAFIQHMLAMFNSSAMLYFLTELTGIEALLPDPYFFGGGLHQIVDGGKLDVHADFNFEENIKLYRRLNLLLYLNPHWEPRYGGQLELWDTGMTGCVERIEPLFNRCVIFNTSSTSYHGHPAPLNVPPGVTRKSIAIYYYTRDPAPGQEAVHGTLWQRLPAK